MNEPSVFNTPSKTIPLEALHFKKDGRSFEHRDLHNAYGALHHRSTWRGLLSRDKNTQRPFVLTRSFFMGSQRFGAYWTGDNNSNSNELKGCLIMLLQNGIAGHPYGGCDIPGFYGNVSEDLFVFFYQLGTYFPFMRAHSRKENHGCRPSVCRMQFAMQSTVATTWFTTCTPTSTWCPRQQNRWCALCGMSSQMTKKCTR